MAPPADGSGLLFSRPRLATRLSLHLGVLVQPYRNGGLTTGNVAEFLETRYGVMAAFYRVRQQDIINDLESSLVGAMETMLMRGKPVANPWPRATQRIEQRFRDFITTREAERGIPGTPTKAALRGVNHRLKHPYALSNPRRPSFRDTGLYMASFRAWVD